MACKTTLFFFKVFLIFVIGIPTIYALFFGAPFLPTSKKAIKRILDNINIKNKMTIYEPGCGDARFLTSISKKANIKTIGFEYSPLVWIYAKIRDFCKRGKNVEILYKDYFKHDFKDADIIFCFLLPKRLDKLKDKLKKECKKGTLVISHGFKIKELKLIKCLEKDKKVSFPTYFYNI